MFEPRPDSLLDVFWGVEVGLAGDKGEYVATAQPQITS
jgi:hypothetical protein